MASSYSPTLSFDLAACLAFCGPDSSWREERKQRPENEPVSVQDFPPKSQSISFMQGQHRAETDTISP